MPWNRSLKQVLTRRLEIIGIPLHLWNEYTLHKVGSCFGELKEVHDINNSFDIAEVIVNLDDKRILQHSVLLREGDSKFNIWVQEGKEFRSKEVD